MVKYSEKRLKKEMEEIRTDLRQEIKMRNLHQKEVDRLNIVLKVYEERLRTLRFKNPTSRNES